MARRCSLRAAVSARPLIGAALAAAMAATLVATTGSGPAGATAGAYGTASDGGGVASRAAAWVRTQQQPDGGFEVAGFPGFETPDAVFALASAAQTGPVWSARGALSALLAQRAENGRTALDYVDDLADGAGGTGAPSAGTAAKLIALVAAPLCMDPANFDPSGDGATDLLAIVDGARRSDGTFGAFNATLYAALAYEAVQRPVPPETIAAIRGGQQANGGWNFDGDPSRTDVDPDTTALAVEVLGGGADDANVSRALAFLAHNQDGSGGWANPSSFSDVNPNSTALASLAVVASGLDPAARAWRDRADPGRAGEPYRSPYDYLAAQQTGEGRIASTFDQYGVNTFPTTQTIEALERRTLPKVAAHGTCPSTGYRMFGADGAVHAFGDAVNVGSLAGTDLNSPVVSGASSPSGLGYFEFAGDGGVFTFGDASFDGSLGGVRLNSPIVGGAPAPSGDGYLLFAADGGVFSFGAEPFLGSLGDRRLNSPIVGGTITPSGRGYVLFAADGGVFSFGDARFAGSLGDRPLNSPIVAGATTPSGAGYELFAADGGVFSFGDAPFLGSLGDVHLTRPIVGGGRSSTGRGYVMFAADGGAFTFGDVPFAGSAATAPLASPVVAGQVL